MDTMEKRTLAFFGQEDRFETLPLLVEYLLLTEDKDRQDAILNVIQRLTMFRDDETYMAYLYSVRNEVYGIDESSDEV